MLARWGCSDHAHQDVSRGAVASACDTLVPPSVGSVPASHYPGTSSAMSTVSSPATLPPGRRAVTRAIGWTTPALAVGVAAPKAAASPSCATLSISATCSTSPDSKTATVVYTISSTSYPLTGSFSLSISPTSPPPVTVTATTGSVTGRTVTVTGATAPFSVTASLTNAQNAGANTDYTLTLTGTVGNEVCTVQAATKTVKVNGSSFTCR